MKNKNNKFIFLLIFLLSFNSCIKQTYNDSENRFTLTDIDSTTFEKYIFFSFKNVSNENFYVLSEKFSNLKDSINISEKLDIGKKYQLNFVHIDTTIVAKLHFTPTRPIDIYSDETLTIWKQDTFRKDIYMSNDIKGLNVIKSKKDK